MDKEKAKRNLEAVMDKIHTETDIVQLSEYRKLFKKEISLFRRSWAAAWLFMYYDKRETPSAKPVSSSAEKVTNLKNTKFKKQNDKQPLEITLSEEESKRLFFSIGKNRRLFPREVITLIMTKTSTPREDIGIIRILDNYSFVQVRDTKADEIIEKLTGLRFRGRTLTVNYAKPKAAEAEEN